VPAVTAAASIDFPLNDPTALAAFVASLRAACEQALATHRPEDGVIPKG